MNVDKMAPDILREGIRRSYPNYDGAEWFHNKRTWINPHDNFTVPTGMFMDIGNHNKNVYFQPPW